MGCTIDLSLAYSRCLLSIQLVFANCLQVTIHQSVCTVVKLGTPYMVQGFWWQCSQSLQRNTIGKCRLFVAHISLKSCLHFIISSESLCTVSACHTPLQHRPLEREGLVNLVSQFRSLHTALLALLEFWWSNQICSVHHVPFSMWLAASSGVPLVKNTKVLQYVMPHFSKCLAESSVYYSGLLSFYFIKSQEVDPACPKPDSPDHPSEKLFVCSTVVQWVWLFW